MGRTLCRSLATLGDAMAYPIRNPASPHALAKVLGYDECLRTHRPSRPR